MGQEKVIPSEKLKLKRMLSKYIHFQKDDLARGKEYGGCEISNVAKK